MLRAVPEQILALQGTVLSQSTSEIQIIITVCTKLTQLLPYHTGSAANVILIKDLINNIRQIVSRRNLTRMHLAREEIIIFKSAFSLPRVVSLEMSTSAKAQRALSPGQQEQQSLHPEARLRVEVCPRPRAFQVEVFGGKQLPSVLTFGGERACSFATSGLAAGQSLFLWQLDS